MTIAFSDEVSFGLMPNIRRTWAPRGQTPTVYFRHRYKRINTIGAVCCTPDGDNSQLHLQFSECSVNTEANTNFLGRLHRDVPGRIILIWDNLSVHKSRKMREYIAANSDWLTVHYFPAYAPELNPIERVWSAIKGKDLANHGPDTIKELGALLKKADDRLSNEPQILKGCMSELMSQ